MPTETPAFGQGFLFLTSCGDLIGRDKVIPCDVWGVLCDGTSAYPAAVVVLRKAREDSAVVILLPNAARLGDEAAAMLAQAGVPGDCFDAILASGQLASEALKARGSPKVSHNGPERHASIMGGAGQRARRD